MKPLQNYIDMTEKEFSDGMSLAASLIAKVESKPSILGEYTPPIYDEHYRELVDKFDKYQKDLIDRFGLTAMWGSIQSVDSTGVSTIIEGEVVGGFKFDDSQ